MDNQRRQLLTGASIGGALVAVGATRTADAQSAPATMINADTVEYTDPVATTPSPPYLRTVSDIINGEPISAFRAIDKSKHADIRAGSNSDDLYPAFSSLLSAMGSANRGQLFIPRGVYNILNWQLSVPPGVTLHGECRSSTIMRFSVGSNRNAMVFAAGSGAFSLTVDALGTAVSGLFIDGANNVTIHDCESRNAKDQGIAISNSSGCQLSSVRSIGAGSRGMLIDPYSHDNQVNGFYAKNCTNAALLIGHGSNGNIVNNIVAINTGNAALWLTNDTFDNVVSGIRIKDTTSASGTPAIYLDANSRNNLISDFHVQSYQIGILLRANATTPEGYVSGDTRGNIIANGRLIGTGSGVPGSAAIKIDRLNDGDYRVVGNQFDNIVANGYNNGLYDPTSVSAIDNRFSNIDLSTDITYKYAMALKNTGNRLRGVDGFTPYGDLLGTTLPTLPATGVPATNPYPFSVQVFVKGMPSNGQVQIGAGYVSYGDSPNGGNGMYILGPGQTITLNYSSGAPSWIWFGI